MPEASESGRDKLLEDVAKEKRRGAREPLDLGFVSAPARDEALAEVPREIVGQELQRREPGRLDLYPQSLPRVVRKH